VRAEIVTLHPQAVATGPVTVPGEDVSRVRLDRVHARLPAQTLNGEIEVTPSRPRMRRAPRHITRTNVRRRRPAMCDRLLELVRREVEQLRCGL